jgi:hypothetical protein
VVPAQTGPLLPAAGGEGIALTVVDALDALLAEEGSFVAALTEMALVAVPADAGALIAIVIAGAAPGGNDARVQVTVEVPLHDQPGPFVETKLAPAGSVSATETDVAVEGPAFDTLSV